MSRIFESWWWTAIMLALFVFWGGFFPSEPSQEPRMYIATNIALVLSLVMCVVGLVAWFIRVRRRAH